MLQVSVRLPVRALVRGCDRHVHGGGCLAAGLDGPNPMPSAHDVGCPAQRLLVSELHDETQWLVLPHGV